MTTLRAKIKESRFFNVADKLMVVLGLNQMGGFSAAFEAQYSSAEFTSDPSAVFEPDHQSFCEI